MEEGVGRMMNSGKITVFVNGKIFTSNPRMPYGDSLVIKDGRILWIGRRKEMPEEFQKAGETVDFCGRRVIPGFVDAHMHPVMLADLRRKITVMPPEVNSIEALIQAIKVKRQQQKAGEWIEGWGYDESGLLEKRSPTRYDLDLGCSDSPVSIMRTCAHIRCVNSVALKLAGIDRNTPDPPGGEIERDAEGEPTGVLKEKASTLFGALLPEESVESRRDHLLELGDLLLSQGITAICDMGDLDGLDNLPVYEAALKKGFRQRTGVYYLWDFFADKESFQILPEMMDRERQLFVAGLKLIGDGSISGRTAWMSRPYLGSDREYGISVCSDELLDQAIEYCREHHCQLAIHAMGGKAIDRMINRVCREKKWTPEGIPYVRMEHVTDPSRESIRKAAEHGISFVTQPIFQYAESASYLANLGPEWMKECYPVRTILEEGAELGFSTDEPATFWSNPSDPFPGLKQAVTRISASGVDCGQDQAVGIETAVRLYTDGSARAAGFSHIGMLAPGYHGDFIVLNRDILTIPSQEIDTLQVMETYLDGQCVYRR